MKKALQYLLICSFSIIFFSACSDSDKNKEKAIVKNTVIVYMLGNNTLRAYISDNLNKMSSTWSDEFDGHCVAIVDNYDLSLVEVASGTRKTIKKYTDKDPLESADMKSMIEEAMRLYPAEKYTLILWSHGLGWLPNHTYPSTRAFGESGNKQMELIDLADGIPNNAFETIIFDACYMGSIEVAYELHNKSNYMIAAPSLVMGEGFPYHITIPQIMQSKSPNDIASAFVQYYRTHKEATSRYATIGVVKMNEMEALAQSTKTFYQKLSSTDILTERVDEIQSFDNYRPHLFYDFKQIVDVLAEYGYQTESDALYNQLNKTVIYTDQTEKFGNIYINANSGLTSYIPMQSSISDKLKNTYQTLSWYTASGASVFFE